MTADDTRTFSDLSAARAATSDPSPRPYLLLLTGAQRGELHPIEGELLIGRESRTDIRIIDEGVSRRHCRIYEEGSQLMLEDLASRNGTFLNGDTVRLARISEGDQITIGGTILKVCFRDAMEESMQRSIYEAALYDALTTVFNRRHVLERLETEFTFAVRHGTPLAVLLMDIDHFKRVNDERGHAAGDEVLRTVGSSLVKMLRDEDVMGRYGGEEFLVIARGLPSANAGRLAERLRDAVANLSIQSKEGPFRITTSIGVALLPCESTRSSLELVQAADAALYEAKATGRNRVVFHDPTAIPEPTRPG